MKRWYVVNAKSNYEHQVQKGLLERIRRDGLEDRFGEVIVPAEEVVELVNGQKRKTQRKFFPGYVLVQIEANTEGRIPVIDTDAWHLVKHTPNVVGFIGGTADRPSPITDKEADKILSRIQTSVEKPQPKVLFENGQMVRITEGPFKDFEGAIEDINYERARARVAVLIFGRSTPVDIEFTAIEKQ
jgi:transcription termination/antitermination protein NusG